MLTVVFRLKSRGLMPLKLLLIRLPLGLAFEFGLRKLSAVDLNYLSIFFVLSILLFIKVV